MENIIVDPNDQGEKEQGNPNGRDPAHPAVHEEIKKHAQGKSNVKAEKPDGEIKTDNKGVNAHKTSCFAFGVDAYTESHIHDLALLGHGAPQEGNHPDNQERKSNNDGDARHQSRTKRPAKRFEKKINEETSHNSQKWDLPDNLQRNSPAFYFSADPTETLKHL